MKFALSAIALAVVSSSAAAADAISSGDTVVVTATRTPQPLASTIRPVDIITSEEIQSSAQQTLAEVLQTRANVEIASNGGYGQPASLFIRGANPTHTLVLLDGIRVTNPLSSFTSFENMRANQFSRIEFVPGPLSSLYGSEAVGGVVQLFTHRWPDSPRAYGSIGFGTYDTFDVNGGVTAGNDRTGLSVNAGYLSSGGFSTTNASEPFGSFNRDKDNHRNRNFSASLVHRFGPDQEAGLNAYYTDGFSRFDFSPTTDDLTRQRIGVFSLYTKNKITDIWSTLVKVGVAQDQISTVGLFPGVLSSRQTQVTWQNDFKTSLGTFIGGFEYLRQQARGDNDFAESERGIWSGFTGYTGEFGRHIVHASLRYDNNSQFGDQVTGAAGYAFRLTDVVRLRASIGTAFHAPTFYDLYFDSIGNPNLQPERSRSWEIGSDFNFGAQRIGLTYFENRIRDLIVLRPPTFEALNVDTARIHGLELSYRAELGGFDISGNLTLQDPENGDTHKQLQRRARVFGNLAVTRNFGRWHAGTEVVGASARYDSGTEDPATKLDSYVLLNLLAGYSISRDLTLEARWNNVTDKKYELVRGYNTPGSNVFVSLRYLLPK